MKDTVAIIGSHPGTRSNFDMDRTDCDVWVFNEAYSRALAPNATEKDKWCKKADAVFQMHLPAVWKNPKNRNDQYHADWLRSGNTPTIYMMERYEEVPMAVKYPLDEVIADIGGSCKAFLTSSPAQAIALAIHQKYKRIEVYGVEMETETEYIYQRDGISYWFGVCDGRGIILVPDCKFMKDRVIYGYEGNVVIPYSDFVNRIEELSPQVQQARAEVDSYRAKTNPIITAFVQDRAEQTRLENAIKALSLAVSQLGRFEGMKQENERYKKKADVMMEASQGEYLFVRQEFEQALRGLGTRKKEYEAELGVHLGSMQNMIGNIVSTGNVKKRINRMNQFVPVMNEFINTSMKVGIMTGAIEENQRYIKRLDNLIRAAGGTKSEEAILGAMEVVNA